MLYKEVDGNIGSGRFCSGPNDPNLSNETIVLAITAIALPAGTVLGQITATKQWKPVDPAAADGSQVAKGILWHAAPIAAATQKNVAVVRHQVVNANLLTWAVAVDATQKAAAEAQLANANVMARY